MDTASRLECPEWALPGLVRALGDEHLEHEMRALQAAAPWDLRVNTLQSTRADALAAIRSVGLSAEPTLFSPLGIRLTSHPAPGQLPGLFDGTLMPQDEGA